MNKAQLVSAVAAKTGSDKRTAAAALDALIDTITTTVAAGEKVAVPGFGSFERVIRPARDARNPATGATVHVPPTATPKFRPGTGFKDAVKTFRRSM